MTVRMAAQAVLPAPAVVRQVRASTALGSPVVEDRMAAPAGMTGGLMLAVAKAVRVAGTRAASLSWVEGRGRFHSSLRSHAGVRFRFFFSSVFYWGEGRFQATVSSIPAAAMWVAALKQRQGWQWWRVLPEPEHPAHLWRLGQLYVRTCKGFEARAHKIRIA